MAEEKEMKQKPEPKVEVKPMAKKSLVNMSLAGGLQLVKGEPAELSKSDVEALKKGHPKSTHLIVEGGLE